MNEVLKHERLDAVREAFVKGMSHLVEAADVFVATIDEFPEMRDVFINELGDLIPIRAWSMIESVGRRACHPKLLMGGFGAKLPLIKKLPYSLQESVINNNRFELLLPAGETLLVSVQDATEQQARQLIGSGEIRSLPKQKAWQAEQDQKQDETFKPEPVSYQIVSHRLLVRRDTTFSKRELKRILSEM